VKKRNVTLSMSDDLLRDARRLAVDEGTSLSGLMTRALESLVRDRRGYHDAMEQELELMGTGLSLGTHGRSTWSREELHER